MRKLLVLMLVLIVTLSGCASIITDIPNFDNNTEPNTPAIEEPQNESENEFDKDDEVSGIKNLELIEANKQFSWEILKKINEDDSGQEVFISPLSISSMLMMAYNGAEGNTKSQMKPCITVYLLRI